MEKFHERNLDLYDCIPRSKLWEVLSEYGINGPLLSAIKSLYACSEAAVRMDGELSEWFEVRNGLRQGCTISPLLFLIYMDKLIKSAQLRGRVTLGGNIISALAYADDLVLVGSSEQELQNSISDLEAACTDFGMTISSTKTQVMHVGKNRKTINCSLNGSVLEQVTEFKYLGCVFQRMANSIKNLNIAE